MIEVIAPGFYTSIQDQGRKGNRHLGIPVSGAMDQKAFKLAHFLLGNPSDTSIIECTLIGPILLFRESCSIVLTGAKMEVWLNDTPIKNNIPINIKPGDTLKLRRVLKGLRTYIKINQVLILPNILGSTSFYKPLTKDSVLKKGTYLFWMKNGIINKQANSRIRFDESYITDSNIYVKKGPEFNVLKEDQKKKLFKESFVVSNQNRMGYRLATPFIIKTPSMLSAAVQPGTVQITPSGILLIAGFDGQVTGGYPRILQLSDEGMHVLFQKKEADDVFFKLCDTHLQMEL